jgi:hypothetical protein
MSKRIIIEEVSDICRASGGVSTQVVTNCIRMLISHYGDKTDTQRILETLQYISEDALLLKNNIEKRL